MPEREIRTVLDGMSYLECPRWHDGRLYVSDFYTQQVYRLDLDGGGAAEPVARVPEQPSGLGWMPDGSMLVVSMRDRRVLRVRDGGEPEVHADLSSLAPWHLNDMVVDPAGRAYVGNFGFDLMTLQPIRETGIIRVDPDGSATVVADGLRFPNGTVIFPAGGPLAAQGAIWAADALGGRVLRIREGGEIVEEVAPGIGVFACGLAGAEGRTLVMCAAPSFAEHERRDTREAKLLACEVDVPRAGLP